MLLKIHLRWIGENKDRLSVALVAVPLVEQNSLGYHKTL